MNATLQQVQLVMADEAFVEKISAMEDPEQVQAAFADKGIDFSLEEIDAIARKSAADADDELNEDDLVDVAGGVGAVAVICCVAGAIKLGADIMTEVNKSRKAKGKKTIW
ncbi:MAG: Nif11-like leader peptide family RiPP precursor [Firmicutes bacterium]|nr:Nif11-like leader peptide family RiPP precursor [Bacillota bacterium]